MTWRTVLVGLGVVGVAGLAGACAPAMSHHGGSIDMRDLRMSVFALDAADGRVLWSRTDLSGMYGNGHTHLSGPLVVVSGGVGGETFDLRSGAGGPPPPGTIPTPPTTAAPAPGASIPPGVRTEVWNAPVVVGAVGVGFDDREGHGDLVGFDPATGERRWTFALDRPAHSAIHRRDGVVVVSTSDTAPPEP